MLLQHVLIYLSADKYVSPFDVMLAYDAGIGQVIPYNNVTPADARMTVSDAMLARGIEGAKYTILFVGGADIGAVERLVEVIKSCMYPPFTHSVIVDPKGSYTTAASTVAKIEDALRDVDRKLVDSEVLVLGGTGTRGQMVAKICAEKKARVRITSLNEASAHLFAEKLTKDTGVQITGAAAQTPREIINLAQGADVIVAAGPNSLQLLPKDALEVLPNCRVAVDLNPIPPAGIGGIEPLSDKVAVRNVTTIGALVVRDLKSVVLNKLYKRAILAEGGGFFAYKEAYEIARTLLHVEK